jgi:hypothetical protein
MDLGRLLSRSRESIWRGNGPKAGVTGCGDITERKTPRLHVLQSIPSFIWLHSTVVVEAVQSTSAQMP